MMVDLTSNEKEISHGRQEPSFVFTSSFIILPSSLPHSGVPLASSIG